MDVDNYLKALVECPDAELRTRHEIHYDWPVVLRADFESVDRDLRTSEKWRYDDVTTRGYGVMTLELGGHMSLFRYVPGVLTLQFADYVMPVLHGDEEKSIEIARRIEKGRYNKHAYWI